MPILTVHHVTTYRYRQPVAFGEHRMMLRPREGHDQRLLEARLEITPQPSELRWLHDVFGNSVALVRFSGRARELRFASMARLDQRPVDPATFCVEPYAATYPFSYGMEEMPDLARSIERHYPDPEHLVDHWAHGMLRPDGPTGTFELLGTLTRAIKRDFTYIARHEHGIQDPARTLKLKSGTCRDFALLLMEAARALGFAARFVSGYVYSPGGDGRLNEGIGDGRLNEGIGDGRLSEGIGDGRLGGGATHAWARIYLPGAGWVEFDPTNAIVGNRDLIRVAVARDPAQAIPLQGTWTGFPADSLGMEVEVTVASETPQQSESS